MKPATALAVTLLAGIGALHVLRLLGRTQVLVNGVEIPMWASAVAALVSLGLALGVWREHRAPGAGR
jgi:hypothetical protein